MRIIAGKYKGHSLAAPAGKNTRPTTDRTRESIFNILANLVDIEGLRILDLFAGSGAMGLEALSRGAGFCLFIDNNSRARAIIRQNVEKLNATGSTKLFRRDATQMGKIGTMMPFDVALLDPPYGKELGPRAVTSLLDGGWLVDNGLVVLEERLKDFPIQLERLTLLSERQYGDTKIGFFRYRRIDTDA